MPSEKLISRNIYLDSVKGLLIFLVVFAHLIGQFTDIGIINRVYTFIYSFHMPAFVFISGALSQKTLNVGKLSKNILIPLVLFDLIYEAEYYLINGDLSGYIKVGAPYWIMWFLLSLTMWRLLTPVLITLKYPIAISVLVSLSAQFLEISGHTLSILRTFSFLPFYVMGLTLSKHLLSCNKFNMSVSFFTLAASTSGLLIISYITPAIFFYGALPFSSLGMPLMQFLTTKMFNFILVPLLIISLISLKHHSATFEKFGINSLSIFVLHGLFVPFITDAMIKHNQHDYNLIIALFISFLLCLVLSSKPITATLDRVHNLVYKLIFNKHEKSGV